MLKRWLNPRYTKTRVLTYPSIFLEVIENMEREMGFETHGVQLWEHSVYCK
jgi:hypothetical protein